ncbi:transcription factor HBP-1b(c38)-like [Rutidosis leptorrhynchoides]|uniref:transcription factor HBP-1b(c38)-like n=1 Tax=Rutidosis leptorrhynchoides TaxID=125765 RepID=UPI003A9952AA
MIKILSNREANKRSRLRKQELKKVNISSDPLDFSKAYSNWSEEHHRLIFNLRKATMITFDASTVMPVVDVIFSHYNEFFRMKQSAANIHNFSIIDGCWMPPTPRSIMWIGGFRPYDIIE